MADPAEIGQQAVDLFTQGYSCAQAVLAACAPTLGLDRETALRLGSSLGAGLGGLRETCGAVTAMAALLGLKDGPTTPMAAKEKAALYQKVQAAIAAFDSTFATHNCRELLQRASIQKQAGVAPEERTPDYYAKRPCAAFVRYCATQVAAAN